MTRPVPDAIKMFAVTAQLVDADLAQVERDFKISLGRASQAAEDTDEDYYPQFDEDLRSEAADMSHYELLYCFEKSVRRLISETLEARAGTAWWDDEHVAPAIQQDVTKRMQDEMDSAVTVRSSDPMDFTTFGELGQIINKNWELFGSIFTSRRAVSKVMANLNTLRALIAHCSVLAEDEVLRLRLSLRDWFRLME